ncbi:MAG: hypothetical protein PHC91_01580 [Eubacteriales bacterium]|nr:hypothetical protein [Eubacteriales bacterium]
MRKLIVVLTVILSLLCGTITASAAADPNVILVNPASNSTTFSNNLLISVKLTQPKTIRVSVFEEKQVVNGTLSAVNVNTLTTANGTLNNASFTSVAVGTPAKFESKNHLSFYTKQINGLKPGLYRIRIDTLNAAGEEIFSRNSYVAVKEKAEAEVKIFDTPQSGTMQFLQNLLKTIFGD